MIGMDCLQFRRLDERQLVRALTVRAILANQARAESFQTQQRRSTWEEFAHAALDGFLRANPCGNSPRGARIQSLLEECLRFPCWRALYGIISPRAPQLQIRCVASCGRSRRFSDLIPSRH